MFSCLKQETEKVLGGKFSLIYSQNVYGREGSLPDYGESVSGLSLLLAVGISATVMPD